MPHHRRNLYVLSATIFFASVSWNQVFPFLPLFLKDIGAGRHLLQWSGAVYAIACLAAIVTLPFWGKMGDKYGQKPMTIRAGVCLTLVYFGMSLCRNPWQLLVLRFLNGALTGFIPGSVALIATNTPKELAPRAVATAQTASAAGQIVGPAIGALLATAIGYRGSMVVSGFAVMVSTLLVWLLVKVKYKPEPAGQTSLLEDFRISLRSPVLASVMLTLLLYSAFLSSIQPFLTLHLGRMSGSRAIGLAGVVFALPPIAFLLSAYPWTRFGERRGHHRSIYIGLAGAAVCASVLSMMRNVWAFSIVYLVAGVFLAALSPSSGAIVCGKVEESFRGRAYGMLYSAGTLGAFVAPLAASHMAVAYGIPSIFVAISGLFVAGAAVFRVLVGKWGRVARYEV
ncbi:MAG: MFS transporter [Armatimonadota bacterium]|nr:MFS transporter [Armatimonadota bacterium]